MVKHIQCRHCGKDVCGNPRLKGAQQYCSSHECQNARRSMWKREQHKSLKNSKVGDKNEKVRQQQSPDHEYMRKYRETHPEYVSRNRKLQKARNQKRITTLPAVLKLPGSLVLQRDSDGSCSLVKIEQLGSA